VRVTQVIAAAVAAGVMSVGLTAPASAAPRPRLDVTVSEPTPWPATAKPDDGLRAAVRADSPSGGAGARRAFVELVATRRADRLAVLLRASGVARVTGPAARATLAAAAGKASRFAIDWAADRDGAGTIETEYAR
jgi:hypothetical protein